ncbi:hypothetical protein QBC38DRAFT_249144 [Podospora fimiseda]|uniref:CBM-cenC domain-containing protein n=1 Tax=Podospora fimiseda TaxID=252190 RepID=A0AAN7GVY1_9PEZI|nr:hypothetical protein QBC38DRAFT_249144 [Podospora fimiseda]
MKSLALFLCAGMLAGVANAACAVPSCGSAKCLGAVAADPEAGKAFCSSWLGLEPATATETVTEIEAVTETVINVETAFTTMVVTTATQTLTDGDPTTVFQKRAEPTVSADPILSACSLNDIRVSKACSCFLSTATASTVTVTVVETAVSTATIEATSTIVETETSNVIATVSVAPPATTIPVNVIVNGNLESYLRTGNILPWASSAPSGGRVEVINGVNPCTTGGAYCAGGQVVVRVFPPTSGASNTRWVAMTENFIARPSTTYNFSWMFRCLNFDTSAHMEILYNGVSAGKVYCPNINTSAFQRGSVQFTTDSTGNDKIEIRYWNPSALPYFYIYADDFTAIKA